MELAFVISADRGVMIDERTGRPNAWSNVHYLSDYREDGEDAVGYKPIKVSCAPEAFEVFKQHGVGLYQLDFRTRPGAMNKPTLTLVKAQHVGSLDVFELGNYRKSDPFQPGQGKAPGAPTKPAAVEQPKAA